MLPVFHCLELGLLPPGSLDAMGHFVPSIALPSLVYLQTARDKYAGLRD